MFFEKGAMRPKIAIFKVETYYPTILLLFLFDNRALVDFQKRNGHVCRPGAHFLFEYRVVVDFQIRNGLYLKSIVHPWVCEGGLVGGDGWRRR